MVLRGSATEDPSVVGNRGYRIWISYDSRTGRNDTHLNLEGSSARTQRCHTAIKVRMRLVPDMEMLIPAEILTPYVGSSLAAKGSLVRLWIQRFSLGTAPSIVSNMLVGLLDSELSGPLFPMSRSANGGQAHDSLYLGNTSCLTLARIMRQVKNPGLCGKTIRASVSQHRARCTASQIMEPGGTTTSAGLVSENNGFSRSEAQPARPS